MEDTLSENDFRPRYFTLSGKYWYSLTSVYFTLSGKYWHSPTSIHSANDDVTLILGYFTR